MLHEGNIVAHSCMRIFPLRQQKRATHRGTASRRKSASCPSAFSLLAAGVETEASGDERVVPPQLSAPRWGTAVLPAASERDNAHDNRNRNDDTRNSFLRVLLAPSPPQTCLKDPPT